MEMIFVRHAEGEHTTHPPTSLEMKHPGLTEKGREQAGHLVDIFLLQPTDIVIVSPTQRTIETARLLVANQQVKKYISPLIGPRMFPQCEEWTTLPCDEIYSRREVQARHGDFEIMDLDEEVWSTGINKMDALPFKRLAQRLVDWSIEQKSRVFLITHDGTINNYRQILGEENVTRDDFLGETGWYRIRL